MASENAASGFLPQLKVRTRLYLGFLTLIVVAALLAGAGAWGISQLGAGISQLETDSTNVERLLTIDTLVETVRRGQVRFMLDGDQGAIRDMQAAQVKAASLLAAAAATTRSAERLALYRAVTTKLADQVDHGGELVDLGKTVSDARARLVVGGDALTAATDKLMAAAREADVAESAMPAERAVLLVRVNNWRFLATRDVAGPEKFRKAVEQATQALDAVDRATASLQSPVSQVRDALALYSRDFETVSTSIIGQSALFNGTLTPLVASMQLSLQESKASLLRDSGANVEQARQSASSMLLTQLLLAVAGVTAGLALAFVIARSIVRPLLGMTNAMVRLAAGDRTVEIPGSGNTDEIGDMARAVDVFKQNSLQTARLAAEQEQERVAKDRRTVRIGELTSTFEANAGALVGQVSAASTELQATAQSMTQSAGESTQLATNVAVAAEQASANVQTVAAAAEELASSIIEISRQVAQSASIAGKAKDNAKRTDDIVQALAAGAQKIGEVVGLISSIAAQTNLLALNATIEAARAGDAGKGFAVVASEVKSLATQTTKATQDIATQIGQIQAATKNAVEAIQGIGTTINEISEIAATIAAAVEQQGSATQEIARNVQQAAAGTQQVSSNISGVTDGANITGSAANQVLGAARELSKRSDELRAEVGHFTAGVKAA